VPESTGRSRSSRWPCRSSGRPSTCATRSSHNRHVVDTLKGKGAILWRSSTRSRNDAPVIFSAHGVPQSVPADAKARRLFYLDATCPLVSKVHAEARDHHENGWRSSSSPRRPPRGGRHAGPAAARRRGPGRDQRGCRPVLAARPQAARLYTQTTLSVDDTAAIVAILKARFPTSSAQEGRHLLRPPPTARRP